MLISESVSRIFYVKSKQFPFSVFLLNFYLKCLQVKLWAKHWRVRWLLKLSDKVGHVGILFIIMLLLNILHS